MSDTGCHAMDLFVRTCFHTELAAVSDGINTLLNIPV